MLTGPLSTTGSGSVTVAGGGGVLLYFTCSHGSSVAACSSGQSGGSLQLTGSGSVYLLPSASSPFPGLTVFCDRNDGAGITLTGSGNFSFSGTLYARTAALTLTGSGSTLSSMIVVGSTKVTGSGSTVVAYRRGQNVQPPGVAYLCSPRAGNC